MSTDIESESLPTHVSLCQERYKHVEERLDKLETKLDGLEKNINKFRLDFFKVMVGTAGTIVVSVIGAIAVILTKH
jgi:tetrahydromethanopterin S-methyltransferase subunit G